ncbi:MAG: HlyD family efflux transporter periplasmic adaptor subunit [Proteobacteria bacterium]|nr:HlyD family efflux transporter periplasmic adaptor subunit [Pseudomonadota bacterium]
MDVSLEPQEKKFKYFIFIIIIIIIILAIAFYKYINNVSVKYHDLVFKKVQYGHISLKAKGFGYFTFKTNEKINAVVSGTVDFINVFPGDEVAKGQLLLSMTNKELSFQLQQAKDEYEHIKLNTLESNLVSDLEISSTLNKIKQLNLRQEVLQKIKNSTHELYKKGIISKNNYLLKESEYKLILLDLQSVRDKYAQLKKSKRAKKEIQRKKYLFEEKKIEKTNKDVNDLKIYSPIAGIMKDLRVEKGDNLNIGAEIAILGAKTPDIALLEFSQYYINDLQVGKLISLFYNNHKLDAKITRIEPTIKDGYVKVEVKFNTKDALEAVDNLRVRGEFVQQHIENVLFIQKPSYFNDTDSFVYVLFNDNMLKKHINAEIVSDAYLLIKTGIVKGEKVLISNHKELDNKPDSIRVKVQ